MDEERRAALMAYCRLDGLTGSDEALLQSLWNAARAYMADAGVSDPKDDAPRRAQYDLCVNALVLNAWDNRGAFAVGGSISDNPALRRMVNQLKLTEPTKALASGAEGA